MLWVVPNVFPRLPLYVTKNCTLKKQRSCKQPRMFYICQLRLQYKLPDYFVPDHVSSEETWLYIVESTQIHLNLPVEERTEIFSFKRKFKNNWENDKIQYKECFVEIFIKQIQQTLTKFDFAMLKSPTAIRCRGRWGITDL